MVEVPPFASGRPGNPLVTNLHEVRFICRVKGYEFCGFKRYDIRGSFPKLGDPTLDPKML